MFGLAREETDLLFCNVSWNSFREEKLDELYQEIDNYHPDRLLNTSTDDLVAYFTEKYSIEVPVLEEANITADQRETQVDVSQERSRDIRDRSRPIYLTGTLVTIEIPFSGDAALFRVQPPTFTLNPPRADIRKATIVLKVEGIELKPEAVRASVDRELSQIKSHLEQLHQSARQFNTLLAKVVREHLERRKNKLLRDRNLVANLGFPIKQRSNVVHTYAAPEVRRKIVPAPPPASTAPYIPEPALIFKDYEHILSTIEHMAAVMECSPSAFHTIDEESLRTHFLVQLNGQYEGQATGETFNYEGKTDILIRSEGRNIFIAECKFWKGAKKYGETIDQLLSYLSWRDTKAAILVFNRNKDFTGMLDDMKKATIQHPNCKALIRQRSETSWQYKFAHRDDPNRELIVTVLAFDVPST